jgi:hypothetical protein
MLINTFVAVLFLSVIVRLFVDLWFWPSEQNAMDIVGDMLGHGYELSCGHHRERAGYFACFHNVCNDADFEWANWDTAGPDWCEAGHANDVAAAIVMAAKIACGEAYIAPPPEDFDV